MITIVLLSLLFSGCTASNVKINVDEQFIEYVQDLVNNSFIPTLQPTLVGFTLPESSGTLYKIFELTVDDINLGHGTGHLQDGYLLLRLNDVSVDVSGKYEAYSFWTIEGLLTLNATGSVTLNVTVTAANHHAKVNMTSCTVDPSDFLLDLHKSSVNWLVLVLEPTIKAEIQESLCATVEKYFINETNRLLNSLPDSIVGTDTGSNVSLSIEDVKVTSDSIHVGLQIGSGTLETDEGDSANQKRDVCFKMSESVAQDLADIFLPPGVLSTKINLLELLYGEKQAGDDVTLRIRNTLPLKIGFGNNDLLLASADVESTIRVKTPNSTINLGKLGMSGVVEARSVSDGEAHFVQYGFNNLIPQNSFLLLNRFRLFTVMRQLKGCSNIRLKPSFIRDIIKMLKF